MTADAFYQEMDDFYHKGTRKHESPTRRLMDQQKASWNHKAHLYPQVKAGEIDMNQYSLTYTVDPKSTYVVQPKEGEIVYDTAFKNPNKFFEKVMGQEVTEHKVAAKKEVVMKKLPSGEMSPTRKKTGHKTDKSTHKRGAAYLPSQPLYYLHKEDSK